MFIHERTFYALVGAVTLVAFLFCFAWARQYEGTKRRYMLYAPYLTALVTVGYFAMAGRTFTLIAANGRPVPMPRFFVYTLTYATAGAGIGVMGGASRRYILAGVGTMSMFIVGVVVNFLFAPPIESLGKLLVVGGLAGNLWLFFGPYTRAAEAVSGPRKLAFGKLRNLVALLLIVYFLVGLTSRQSLGLLDAFTGVYVTGYLDILGHIGYAVIVLRSREAIEELAAERSSPLGYFRGGTPESSQPESAPGD